MTEQIATEAGSIDGAASALDVELGGTPTRGRQTRNTCWSDALIPYGSDRAAGLLI